MVLFNGRFELALYVLIARGVVLEMPQLPTTDSKGFQSPTPEDPTLSSSSADKDQKLFDQVASRLAHSTQALLCCGLLESALMLRSSIFSMGWFCIV